MKNQSPASPLLITHNISLAYAFSFVIALLMASASVAGLLYHTSIYPTDELLKTFVPNDVVNLFIGLPILLGSMGLAWRGKPPVCCFGRARCSMCFTTTLFTSSPCRSMRCSCRISLLVSRSVTLVCLI